MITQTKPITDEEQKRVDLMLEVLQGALNTLRSQSGFKGDRLDQITSLVLASFIWKQGNVNPSIPLSVARSLMHMAVDNGFASSLGMEVIDGGPTIQ